MSKRNLPMTAFWMLTVLAPFAICAIAISAIMPDNGTIPLHWDANGQADRYGSPDECWVLAPIVSTCNAIFALAYAFSDKLCERGSVHGIGCDGIRPLLVGAGAFMVLLCAIIMVCFTYSVLSAI